MSSEQPFDSLGRILASGVEIAVALAMNKGYTPGQIGLLILRRVGDLEPSLQNQLEDVSRNILNAGQSLNDLEPGSDIPLGSVPIISELFGDDPQGNRFLFSGEISLAGEDKWYRVDILSGTPLDIDSLRNAILEEQQRITNQYPGSFGGKFDDPDSQIDVRITISARRF